MIADRDPLVFDRPVPIRTVASTWTRSRILELLEGRLPAPPAALPPLSGLTADTRRLRPGDLFAALRGSREDARGRVREAQAAGAVAVLADGGVPDCPLPLWIVPDARVALGWLAAAFEGHPSRDVRVVGVTGTNGKTTTAALLCGVLEAAGRACGKVGTITYRAGGSDRPAGNTTPDPLILQRLLAEMRDAGERDAVVEVSSHALDQSRTAGMEFAGAVFTNLSRDHLDYHRTMEAYLEAKRKLFLALAPAAFAIVNADETVADELVEGCRARIVRYALRDPGADVRGRILDTTPEGLRLRLALDEGGTWEIPTSLVGNHNAENLLAAAAAAEQLGIPGDRIASGLAAGLPVRGRLEPVRAGQPFVVLVDYAHTDDALRNVLGAVRPLARGRLLVLFGCGGDRDSGKRPLMARAAEEGADFLVLTSDNPRSEDPEAILDQVAAGLIGARPYRRETDRRTGIRAILEEAGPGDVVVLAGKGHETVQIFADRSIPFDDRAEAEAALRVLGYAVPGRSGERSALDG